MDDVSRNMHRAFSEEEKEAIVNRLLCVWLENSELRLGQLLANPLAQKGNGRIAPHISLMVMQDEDLIQHIEDYYEEAENREDY